MRWLVSFDDIPSRKDEEIPEEAIGPVVGHFETVPKTSFDSTSNGDALSIITPYTYDNNTATTINSDTITTRSLRKKSISGSCNSSSSADDSATKIVVKKKRGGSNASAKKQRVPSAKANQDTSSTIVLQKASLPKEKVVLTAGVAQELTTSSSKATGREQRSRRRQALSHDEVSQQRAAVSTTTTTTTTTTVSAVTYNASPSLSLTNKRPIAQSSSSSKARGDGTSRNKKAKVGGVSNNPRVRGKTEVLKVQLLTGTLYLYRGAPQRHVEFIPKY